MADSLAKSKTEAGTPAAEPGTASAAGHWKRRSSGPPIPRDQALRQGAVSLLAFELLGREDALAFLNSDHPNLGGQPLKLATASAAGQVSVEAEIQRVARDRKPDAGLSR